MRRHTPRVSNLLAGLIGIVVVAIACYFVFGLPVPFQGPPYVLKAVFTDNVELHIPSPVRIAGVQVGQAVAVARRGDGGVVTMDIDPQGLPIHAGATAQIRSRIFLEGNFYIDLHPGSPEARDLPSGSLLPAANTSGPVQLDRILSSLNQSARTNLQTLIRNFGASLNAAPTSAQDAGQDPLVRGLTGGQALNRSLQYSARAFEASAIVNQALLGTAPHDLSGTVTGEARTFQGFADSGGALPSFVDSFEATMATLASRQSALARTIATLPGLLRNTNSSDVALDASFAPTQAFARRLTPGLKQLDPTIGAALPWLAQATALASPSELGALLAQLTPAVQRTSATLNGTRRLLGASDALARCFIHNIIPAGNQVILDPPGGTGERVYQELFQSAVGIAGAAGNFDGNGRYVRASAGGGAIRAQTPSITGNGPFYGNFVLPPLGTRPAWTTTAPAINRSTPCYANAVPDLNAAATGAGP
jgi:phospholipid/cholesterol/gamma-HCH transport system substrate-binding protein